MEEYRKQYLEEVKESGESEEEENNESEGEGEGSCEGKSSRVDKRKQSTERKGHVTTRKRTQKAAAVVARRGKTGNKCRVM